MDCKTNSLKQNPVINKIKQQLDTLINDVKSTCKLQSNNKQHMQQVLTRFKCLINGNSNHVARLFRAESLATAITTCNPFQQLDYIINFNKLETNQAKFEQLDTLIKSQSLAEHLSESARHNLCLIILANLALFNEWSQVIPTCNTHNLEQQQLSQQQHYQQFSTKIYRAVNYLLAEYWAVFILCQNPGHFDTEFCVPFLFTVAGAYAILDNLVDSSSTSDNTKQVIQIFGWYLNQLSQTSFSSNSESESSIKPYPENGLTQEVINYSREIRWLVCKIAASLSKLPAENRSVIIAALQASFSNELDCYRIQFRDDNTPDTILNLGIDKGITSINLIMHCLGHQKSPDELMHGYSSGVLMQVMDDLSDWQEDSAAGICTFASLFPDYETYIVFSGLYLAQFIDSYFSTEKLKTKTDSRQQIITAVLVMHWVYCICKNLPDDSAITKNILSTLELDHIITPILLKSKRREKHSAKLELYRVFFNG